jgi:hypothetical protein
LIQRRYTMNLPGDPETEEEEGPAEEDEEEQEEEL